VSSGSGAGAWSFGGTARFAGAVPLSSAASVADAAAVRLRKAVVLRLKRARSFNSRMSRSLSASAGSSSGLLSASSMPPVAEAAAAGSRPTKVAGRALLLIASPLCAGPAAARAVNVAACAEDPGLGPFAAEGISLAADAPVGAGSRLHEPSPPPPPSEYEASAGRPLFRAPFEARSKERSSINLASWADREGKE
jgi:hypothetical protein